MPTVKLNVNAGTGSTSGTPVQFTDTPGDDGQDTDDFSTEYHSTITVTQSNPNGNYSTQVAHENYTATGSDSESATDDEEITPDANGSDEDESDTETDDSVMTYWFTDENDGTVNSLVTTTDDAGDTTSTQTTSWFNTTATGSDTVTDNYSGSTSETAYGSGSSSGTTSSPTNSGDDLVTDDGHGSLTGTAHSVVTTTTTASNGDVTVVVDTTDGDLTENETLDERDEDEQAADDPSDTESLSSTDVQTGSLHEVETVVTTLNGVQTGTATTTTDENDDDTATQGESTSSPDTTDASVDDLSYGENETVTQHAVTVASDSTGASSLTTVDTITGTAVGDSGSGTDGTYSRTDDVDTTTTTQLTTAEGVTQDPTTTTNSTSTPTTIDFDLAPGSVPTSSSPPQPKEEQQFGMMRMMDEEQDDGDGSDSPPANQQGGGQGQDPQPAEPDGQAAEDFLKILVGPRQPDAPPPLFTSAISCHSGIRRVPNDYTLQDFYRFQITPPGDPSPPAEPVPDEANTPGEPVDPYDFSHLQTSRADKIAIREAELRRSGELDPMGQRFENTAAMDRPGDLLIGFGGGFTNRAQQAYDDPGGYVYELGAGMATTIRHPIKTLTVAFINSGGGTPLQYGRAMGAMTFDTIVLAPVTEGGSVAVRFLRVPKPVAAMGEGGALLLQDGKFVLNPSLRDFTTPILPEGAVWTYIPRDGGAGTQAGAGLLVRPIGQADAMFPGSLDPKFAETFPGGRYSEAVLLAEGDLYRAGTGNTPLGQFWDLVPPESIVQARIDKAILPKWPGGATSPIDSAIQASFPPGTRIYIGEVGTQSGFYVGGTQQIVILKPWTINGVVVKGIRPLP